MGNVSQRYQPDPTPRAGWLELRLDEDVPTFLASLGALGRQRGRHGSQLIDEASVGVAAAGSGLKDSLLDGSAV